MTVFQLIQNIESISSGPSYSVTTLSKHLAEIGVNVEIFAFGKSAGIHVDGVKFNFISKDEGVKSLFKSEYRDALETIYSTDCAVLHGHAVWSTVTLAPLFKSRINNTKIIWSPRGSFSEWSMSHHRIKKLPVWYIAQKPAMNRVDCFHATAESEYLDIRRLGFKQPVCVIPNGVDIPDEIETKKEKLIVFLSRIHKKKGLEMLIDVWERINNDYTDWTLKIVGPLNDGYSKNLLDGIAKRKISRLEFLGEVIGKDKSNLLSRASLFVLPTYSENFGIVVAEALAHSVPVITTTETPWKGVQDNKCGWIISPKIDELESTLNQALSEPLEKLEQMGKNGKEWISIDYKWDSIARNMLSTYQWLGGNCDKPDCVVLD